MIGNEINALRSKNRPFDDPCRDNKDSELDSFFFVCVCVFCVCFVSSLGFFFFCISLAIKIHAKARDASVERRRCARARFFRRAMMTSALKMLRSFRRRRRNDRGRQKSQIKF